jgi:hypothetical protein
VSDASVHENSDEEMQDSGDLDDGGYNGETVDLSPEKENQSKYEYPWFKKPTYIVTAPPMSRQRINKGKGKAVEVPPEFKTDIIITDVEEQRPRATAIAHLANLLTLAEGADVLAQENILWIKPFSAAAIIDDLMEQGVKLGKDGRKAIFKIMRDPTRKTWSMHIGPSLANEDEAPASFWRPDAPVVDGTTLGIQDEDEEDDQSKTEVHTQKPNEGKSIPSRDEPNPGNPTGQWEQDFETIYQDPKTGRWMIKFEKTFHNGKYVYTQIDPLPYWDNSKKPFEPTIPGEITTFIRPHYQPLPLYTEKDSGEWQIDPEHPGEWKRHYAKPTPRQKDKVDDVAKPMFVLRKFDRSTGRYLQQYRYGKSWTEFEEHVLGFTLKSEDKKAARKCAENFNRWLRQVSDRNSFEYERRATRERFKAYELNTLRKFFNTLIRNKGIIAAQLSPPWSEAVRLVNMVRREYDPRAALRDENSIKTMVDRDSLPDTVPSLGIAEWRALGHTLLEFQQAHPNMKMDEKFLKPRDAIPSTVASDEKQGPPKKGQRGAGDPLADQPIAAPGTVLLGSKITPTILNGKFALVDRFDGALIEKLFGVETVRQDIYQHVGRNIAVRSDADLEAAEALQMLGGGTNVAAERPRQLESSNDTASGSTDSDIPQYQAANQNSVIPPGDSTSPKRKREVEDDDEDKENEGGGQIDSRRKRPRHEEENA